MYILFHFPVTRRKLVDWGSAQLFRPAIVVYRHGSDVLYNGNRCTRAHTLIECKE